MSTTDDLVEIIKQLAAERATFTSDDIRPLLPEGVTPKSIPAAVGKARRDGLVEEVDRVKSTIPERKGSLVAVLRRSGSHLGQVATQPGVAPTQDGSLADAAEEIIRLKDYLNATGYVCGVEEVAAFVLLLASRGWVILSGPSGTGKSSLVRRVAEAVDGVFHDVQVKPNWVSSEDSLGYFSEVSQTFVPGVVLSALREAQDAGSGFHFVRLDEMNLASPEYYLAEVLSAGEAWEADASGEVRSDAIQLPPAPDGVPLPDVRLANNVFLVGTVNVDETTRPLSPKVLDRSAVYDLRHVDLFAVPAPASEGPADPPSLPKLRALLRDRPRSLIELSPSPEAVAAVASLLTDLSEAGELLGGPIGYRQRDAILTMVTLGQRHGLDDVLSFDTIIDLGLRTAVMPKWQGATVPAYHALRRALAILLDVDLPDDASVEVIQGQASVSRFPRSCEKLLAMVGQFNSLGHFSAW